MDSFVLEWSKAVCSLRWIDLNHSARAVRCSSRVSTRSTVFCTVHGGCFPDRRGAELLHPWVIGYADDLQIYDHCFVRDTQQLNDRLVQCIDCMGQWMRRNRLKLNAAKTEFIWLGSVRRLATCSFGPIVVHGEVVRPSLKVRDLSVIIDPAISFADHVAGLARNCYFQIRQLRSIRRSLTIESCHVLVRAMILLRLDYCNGLLGGAPKSLLAQLSGVMRAAARLILVLPRQSHVTSEIRARLHWLDGPSRVQFKLCCFAFRCLHGSAPPIWRLTSLLSAQLRDALSFDRLPPGYFSSLAPGL